MPEINPYESPQSDTPETAPAVRPEGDGYPAWIGTALNVQLGMILAGFFFAMIVTGPPNALSEVLALGILIIFLSLTLTLFFAAIYYRIGWLVMLELVVISLPLTALITSLFNR